MIREAEFQGRQKRKWMEAARSHPENFELRSQVLSLLWKSEEFKAIWDLLPSLDSAGNSDQFEALLKLRTQTLCRLAASGTSQLKKLISHAVAYGFCLGADESAALLEFVDELIRVRQDPLMAPYKARLVTIAQAIRRASDSAFEPRFALGPELAAACGRDLQAAIGNYLKQAKSPFAVYFQPGGHLLFLGETGFVSEIQTRDRKLVSTEINFRLDAITRFHSGKKIDSFLESFPDAFIAEPETQLALAAETARFLSRFENAFFSKELAKTTLEIAACLKAALDAHARNPSDQRITPEFERAYAGIFATMMSSSSLRQRAIEEVAYLRAEGFTMGRRHYVRSVKSIGRLIRAAGGGK